MNGKFHHDMTSESSMDFFISPNQYHQKHKSQAQGSVIKIDDFNALSPCSE